MDRLQQLRVFLEEDPDDAFTRFAIATEYLKRGEAEVALEYFEGLVKKHPDYVGTYYHLAGLYRDLGRAHEAIATYRRGIGVAESLKDFHARAELQSALLEVEGLGSDDEL